MNTGCERRQLSGMVLGTAACGCFAVLLLASGCNQPAPVDTKAAEDAVRAADAAWSKAAGARDLTSVLSYYTDDSYVLPPNQPMATTKQAVHDGWAAMLVPGTDVSWTSSKVEAASSGDMVYDVGTYTASMKDAKGKPASDKGKYVVVWKKQADGSWKAVADTWNSDLPVVAAANPVAAKKRKR